MFTQFCQLVLVATTVLLFSAWGVTAQPADREFGWSLTVSPKDRKRQERSRTETPRELDKPATDEIRIETQLVLSDLLVQDGKGIPVPGLTATDFEITEDGVRQGIDVFAYGDSEIPRSIILVIDHSFSQRPYIDLSIAAAKVLVDSMRPSDRLAIVSDDVELVSDFTSDKVLLKDRLESLRVKCNEGRFGASKQYSSLFASLMERTSRNGTRNIIIFQTDGDELGLLPKNPSSVGSPNFTLEDIVSVATRKGVTIYSVFTGMLLNRLRRDERAERVKEDLIARAKLAEEMRRVRAAHSKPAKFSDRFLTARSDQLMAEEAAVSAVSTRTGGIAQVLVAPENARQVYDNILSDIGRRYLIGYYPSEPGQTGTREREVQITLRSRRGHRIIGGRTYIAY